MGILQQRPRFVSSHMQENVEKKTLGTSPHGKLEFLVKL